MAQSNYEVLEVRAVIKPELTHLYVRTSPASDGMLGVGGWYHMVIPATVPAMDALTEALMSQAYLVGWDRGAPHD